MDPAEPTVVCSLNDPVKAGLLRAELQAEGIPCEIEGERQAGLTGVLPIRLLVPASQAEQAKEFLESHGEV